MIEKQQTASNGKVAELTGAGLLRCGVALSRVRPVATGLGERGLASVGSLLRALGVGYESRATISREQHSQKSQPPLVCGLSA